MAFIRSRIVGLKAMRDKARVRAKTAIISKSAHALFKSSWESGGNAFLKAALRQLKLVETGMTAATFFELSQKVNRTSGTSAVNRAMDRKVKEVVKGIPTFPEGKTRGGFKSTREGKRLGKASTIFRTGSPTRPVFVFSFTTIAFQHAFFEPRQGSMNAGIAAFIQAINTRVIRDLRLIARAYLTGRSNEIQRLQTLPPEQ